MNNNKVAFEDLMQKHREWTAATFPEATAMSSIEKCRDELDELQIEVVFPSSKELLTEEYVDSVMCLLDSASRAGVTVNEFVEAFRLKLEKNKARKWIKNANNTYSHIK